MKDVTESSKTDFFLKMPNFLASMSDSCKDYFPSWSTSITMSYKYMFPSLVMQQLTTDTAGTHKAMSLIIGTQWSCCLQIWK